MKIVENEFGTVTATTGEPSYYAIKCAICGEEKNIQFGVLGLEFCEDCFRETMTMLAEMVKQRLNLKKAEDFLFGDLFEPTEKLNFYRLCRSIDINGLIYEKGSSVSIENPIGGVYFGHYIENGHYTGTLNKIRAHQDPIRNVLVIDGLVKTIRSVTSA